MTNGTGINVEKKDITTVQTISSIEILEGRVVDVLRTLNRNTLRRSCNSVKVRCQKCVDQNGRHIEQFL